MVDLHVNYDFYVDSFEGSAIPSESFDKYINDAYLKVMNKIRNNLYDLEEDETEIIDSIKKCQCELAEFNYQYGLNSAQNQLSQSPVSTGEVKSETAGSTSRTYVTSLDIYGNRTERILSNPKKYENEIIRKYLGYTGLLYIGLE